MNRNKINRAASLVLALCVFFGCMPARAMAQDTQVQSKPKIADASTLNAYKEYFSEDSTAYAGLVWTDKSVFTDETALKTALELKGNVLPTVKDCPNGHSDHKEIKLTENENFLVALSTTASNKSIDGYRERPTDTIFVLDVTGSMDSGDSGTERIQKLVPAVNNAISMLMDNNKNNRVGVVVYAGSHTSVQEFLELGRYTAQTVPGQDYREYIKVQSDGDYIWVGETVRKEGSSDLFNPDGKDGKYSHRVHNSTYIQGGLQMAEYLFTHVDDVKAEIRINGELQNTVRRIPALVLVTDGNPTMSTADYASRGAEVNESGVSTIETGSGGDDDSTVGMGFLCQLTALWTKEEMGKRYNEITDISQLANVSDPVIPLFYTLGIQIQGRPAASITLDPAGNKNNESLNKLWNDFNSSDSGQILVNVSEDDDTDNDGQNLLINRDPEIQNYKYSPDQIYVDEAFEIKTNDSSEYEAALKAIVEAIKLQSGYTPTMLQSSDGFADGYVTFSDDVGEHMEFKDVKGLVLEDCLFTGEHVAGMFTGDKWETTGSGELIADAITTRLHIEKQLAIDLVDAAYEAKLLGPKSRVSRNGVEVGNSFGWFADEDMNILKGYSDGKPNAFWDWKNDPQGTASGAAYRVRSFIFYDEMGSDNAYKRDTTRYNTIFMSVQVREHIESGKVSLIWRIPSRLIPMNEYVVSLHEGNKDVKSIKLNEGEENKGAPVRLVYEVGPKEGYRSYQIEETMRNLKAKSYGEVDVQNLETDIRHIVKAEDGISYYLYSNAVDKTLEGNYQNNDRHVSQEDNTVAYFKPSNQNERYRFSVETIIYTASTDSNHETTYTEYRGASINPDAEYWYKQYVFAHESAAGNTGDFADPNEDGYGIITIWHQVHPDILKENSHQGHEHIVRKDDGTWVMLPNTAEYPTDAIQAEKEKNKYVENSEPNPTDTLTYSDYAVLEMVKTDKGEGYPHDHIEEDDYIISSVLGNNGRLIVTPDTGIAIRKAVENPDDLTPNQTFNFTITRTDEGAETDDKEYKVVIEHEHEEDTVRSFRFDENQSFEFSLVNGETAHVLGLPVGSTYTITEESGDNHKLEKITVTDRFGSTADWPTAEDVEVYADSQVYVTFTNEVEKTPGYASLALKKIVSHETKRKFEAPEDAEFIFQLIFEKDENGKNIYAGDIIYDTDGNAYELGPDGRTNDVVLAPEQVIVFTGLDEGTKVTVMEIIEPGSGYRIEEIIAENVLSFEVSEDKTAEVVVDPQKDSSVTVNNMYLEPDVPLTGDDSRLIFWTTLLVLCSIAAAGMRRHKEEC